jgi:hypothetical protein
MRAGAIPFVIRFSDHQWTEAACSLVRELLGKIRGGSMNK